MAFCLPPDLKQRLMDGELTARPLSVQDADFVMTMMRRLPPIETDSVWIHSCTLCGELNFVLEFSTDGYKPDCSDRSCQQCGEASKGKIVLKWLGAKKEPGPRPLKEERYATA